MLKKKQRALEQNAAQHWVTATMRSFCHAWFTQSIWRKRKHHLVRAATKHFSKNNVAKVILTWSTSVPQRQEFCEAADIIWRQGRDCWCARHGGALLLPQSPGSTSGKG